MLFFVLTFIFCLYQYYSLFTAYSLCSQNGYLHYSITSSVIQNAIIPLDILTNCEKINEPELYYESGFNLLLSDSHLEDYYKVDIDDFVSVTKNFDIISREIDN